MKINTSQLTTRSIETMLTAMWDALTAEQQMAQSELEFLNGAVVSQVGEKPKTRSFTAIEREQVRAVLAQESRLSKMLDSVQAAMDAAQCGKLESINFEIEAD